MLECEKYLNRLREKRATRGEKVLGSLFPTRGTGWPGGWSQDRLEQVLHYKNWLFVAIDTILCKTASITPNMAYVHDKPVRGVTTKACHRGLMNSQGGGFGGGYEVKWGTDGASMTPQYAQRYTNRAFHSGVGLTEGGHSWMTMGEYRSKALSVVKPHEDLEPLENDHPLRRLWENPNPVDTSFDIAYELGMFEELCGVSYEWLVPNDWGMPCERWCIPSHWVWPRTGGGRYVSPEHPYADQLIQYYEVRPWGGMGSAGMLKLPPPEVIMTRWKSPINKIDGYAKTAAIAQWIDSEESISKSRWSQFINQARPELWVELAPGYEDPNDNMIARLEAKFAAKFQGEFNYGRPIITPPGAKLTPLSFSPTEMAYFESEEQIRDMILSTWRVPPAAVGIVKEMTYGSILATLMALCSFCINPRLVMRGQTYTKHLAVRWNEPNRKVRLWWDDTTPADPDQVNKDIAQDLAGWSITPNEQRALRGRKSWGPMGDMPWIQGPGGPMPFPVNDASTLEELARMAEPMATMGQEPEQPAMPGMQNGSQPGNLESNLDNQHTNGESEESSYYDNDMTPGIDEPNGEVQEAVQPGEFEHEVAKDTDLVRLARSFLKSGVKTNKVNDRFSDSYEQYRTVYESTV